ncbi:MAG TPA: hypothetical protein VNB22_22910 [Pyrinomonadaceae bacterium]|nr:hypothetical protein [Pyrinomonadaceae bacterium]
MNNRILSVTLSIVTFIFVLVFLYALSDLESASNPENLRRQRIAHEGRGF